MKIFDINKGHVVLDPNVLAIKEFKKLWDRDDSKDKSNAYNDISYITFVYDNSKDNPYRGYNIESRKKIVAKDVYGKQNVKLDKDVKNAINKFVELQETTYTRLLTAGLHAAEKLTEYYHNVDFSKVDSRGKSLYDINTVTRNLKELGDLIKSLKSLEEMVRKDELDNTKVRGDNVIGPYELPRNLKMNE